MEQVSWSEEETLNLGNYQSHKIRMSLETSLREGEAIEDAVKRCQAEVRLHLEARKAEILPAPKESEIHPSNVGVDIETIRQQAREMFAAFQKSHPKLAKELVEKLPKDPTVEDYDRMILEMKKVG